jgi:diguanylate cyclase (GGDEF)-like protein
LDVGVGDVGVLYSARMHTMRLTARRSATIVARIRFLAVVFAVLTPLWGIVDFWTLEPARRLDLVPIRVLTSVAFLCVLLIARPMHTLRDTYRALLFFFAVPSAFFLYCYLNAIHHSADGVLDGLSAGYAYLPSVMLAGLAVFPLTLIEGAGLAVLLLAVQVVAWIPGLPVLHWPTAIGTLWALALIAAISLMASISQLALMYLLVREGLRDGLTRCYSRRAGEEMLAFQFYWSSRSKAALSVALVTLDGFQEANERFGYEAGDDAMRSVAESLNDRMRAGDALVRWTGNEFLAIMPLASAEQAEMAVQRLLTGGLGLWPDGKPLTASIGVADRARDQVEDWWMMVDAAAGRAKSAQDSGGNRTTAR